MALKRRWDDATHFRNSEFEQFWSDRLTRRRDILLVVGRGWDPRMTVFPKLVSEIGGEGRRTMHLVCYCPFKTYESPYLDLIERNSKVIKDLKETWKDIEEVGIYTRKEGNFYIGDDEIAKYCSRIDLSTYSEIIVDISSLPKSLFFTLLFYLVKKTDKQLPGLNIHVVGCQDVELDNKITESVDVTRVLKGFKGQLHKISQQKLPKIWAPVLAKNKSTSLTKLYEYIGPEDIYPILPFPSRNPRSDDDLIIEYRNFFTSEWNLNPLNIIYAAEDDPLDVYRRLFSLYQQQEEALAPLGGISMVVSALSSKISSIGAFMAAYEKKMSLVHSIGRHEPPEGINDFWRDEKTEKFKQSLHSIWLTGEPYE